MLTGSCPDGELQPTQHLLDKLTLSCSSSIIVALVYDLYQLRLAERGRWTKFSFIHSCLFTSMIHFTEVNEGQSVW